MMVEDKSSNKNSNKRGCSKCKERRGKIKKTIKRLLPKSSRKT